MSKSVQKLLRSQRSYAHPRTRANKPTGRKGIFNRRRIEVGRFGNVVIDLHFTKGARVNVEPSGKDTLASRLIQNWKDQAKAMREVHRRATIAKERQRALRVLQRGAGLA